MVDFNKLRLQKQERLHTMANANRARFAAEEVEQEEESPKGFNADDLPSSDNEESSGMSLEELEAMGFDKDEVEQAIKVRKVPSGDWEKVDRWEFAGKQVNTKDKMPRDFDPAGRTIFTFKGQPKARTENSISYQPNFNIRISPDKRPKIDYETKEIVPNKTDSMYNMFLDAWETYTAVHGEEPGKMRDIIRFMCEDDYIVRTMPGDNGLIFTGIKPPASFKRKRK